MGTVSVADDNLWDCARALRPVADYQLEPALDDRRLRDLGERKEFLSPEEHAELIDLVAFSRKRSIEKLGARLALACCKVGLERPLIPTAVVANLFRSARVFRWDAASRGLGDQRSQRTGGSGAHCPNQRIAEFRQPSMPEKLLVSVQARFYLRGLLRFASP